MRRRKWRRIVNRYALKGAFRSTRIKLDYREPTLGRAKGDTGEGKALILIIGVVVFFFVLFCFHGLR
jgi:hypothetical protein